jgi:nitroimidazol reductase NimA-like FMN-containing flavoprotein (pyridoxamine 5'-phosphate oxidase superfamily)
MAVTDMTDKECWQALAAATFGRLACARNDQPYVVPIFFAMDHEYLYSFSVAGQKLEWMRGNPRVCLEIDNVKSWNDWMSIVAFGRYQELSDTPDWQTERKRAHELLQQRAMWWQPGAAILIGREGREGPSPVFFRIVVERLSGHRASSESASSALESEPQRGWLKQFFRSGEAKR